MVSTSEGLFKDFLRHRNQVGMRNPRSVETISDLAQLVLADLGQGGHVDLWILPTGNEGRHSSHRVGPSSVASPDQQLAIGAHERDRHRHLGSVRQHQVASVPQHLDQAEDVVPPPGVQAAGVISELVEDLLHFERRRQRFDQNGGADRTRSDRKLFLGELESLAPQASLVVTFHFRQIEIGTGLPIQELARVVKQVQAEVEQAARDGLPIDQHVLFRQVPSSRTDQQRGNLRVEAISLPVRGAERQGAPDRIDQVDLPLDHVLPGGRKRILEVGHEDIRA